MTTERFISRTSVPQELKLNLGSGTTDVREGYVNVDLLGGEGVVKCDLVEFLTDLPNGVVDEIVLRDILEHFPHGILEVEDELEYIPTTKITSLGVIELACLRLKPQGLLVIRVPDIEWIMEQAVSGDFNWDRMVWAIFGNQESAGGYHYTGWTEFKLNEVLTDIGLEDVDVVRNPPNLEATARRPEVLTPPEELSTEPTSDPESNPSETPEECDSP